MTQTANAAAAAAAGGATSATRNRMANVMTAELVEELMGVEGGSIGPMAWLLIQEQAAGVSLKVVGEQLGCSQQDLEALRDSVTGESGESSVEVWMRGVLAIQTATRINQVQTAQGWDAVEAIAVDKLSRTLSSMKTDGDPMKMLQIATQANRAMRRRAGEGPGRVNSTNVQVNAMGAEVLTLKGGNLGTLRLNLSPKVQAQLANPNRVIDSTAKRIPNQIDEQLSMLSMNETRKLVPDSASRASAPVYGNGKGDVNTSFDFEDLLAAG